VDFESNIKAIDNFVKEIDRLMQQVLVEVRIYDVTTTEGFDIGAEWDAGRNNPITGISNVDTFNEITGTSTTNVTTKTTNTAWQDSDAGLTATSYAYRKSNPFVGGSFDADTAGTIRLGLLDTVNVDIALNVLRTQVGAKLLANPRILVLDNKTAEFKIISEIPYTERTIGQTTEETTQFKEVGVQLKVTPHVTREGMIRLHIVPEFGVVVGTLIAGQAPTVDTRKVDTEALVKDGQTVVLGGLRKREVTQDVTKVPLLGDIPLLGRLFMDTEEEVKTNELIIFITPRIITEPTLSSAETNSLEATNFGGPKVTYTEDEKAEKSEK
jgi:type IV pilus assembly protein PilQ